MISDRNPELEILLKNLNEALAPIERDLMDRCGNDHSIPVIFQIGLSRTGSTVFTQWASSLGEFSNPTNFLSRFYRAPYIGALIFEMMTNPKYSYKEEFFDLVTAINYESRTGKTRGFRSPHEFWWFWNQHIPPAEIPLDNDSFNKTADFDSFNKEISLITQAFGKPFILKAHNINWHLKSFSENVKNAIYVHIYRDPIANIRSLLKARLKWHGRIDRWFGFKPREFKLIEGLDVYHQVAGQVYFTEKAICEDRPFLEDRYIGFSYEAFCRNPTAIYRRLVEKINMFSRKKMDPIYRGIEKFSIPESRSEFDEKKIVEAYHYFLREYGEWMRPKT